LSLRKDTDPLREKKPDNTITSQHETQKQRVKGRECAESVRVNVALDKSIEKRYKEWERENDSAEPVS
jgi:hypothetical protein